MRTSRKGAEGCADDEVARGQPPRVLVVDDHEAMLAHVARLLRIHFRVAGLMRDGESLLERWSAARPDVIVLDISLPGCTGLDAARKLRAAECAVPIVFLSFHQEPEFVRAAWAAGGAGYVVKQDMGRELVPAIRAALGGRRFASTSARVD